MPPEPSRLRRELGAELRAARKLGGVTQRDLVKPLGVEQPTISRLELGTGALPTRSFVLRWLDACSAPEEIRERALVLLQAAHTETRPYPELFTGGHAQGAIAVEERDASLIRNYQATWVPGLLQTAEYARLVIRLTDPAGQVDHAAAAAARLDRQTILYEEGRRFEFLIARHVLEWSPGPEVSMPAQLDRLGSLATLPSVRIAVLPSRREGVPDWHSFIITTPADGGPAVVTAELLGGYWTASDPAVVGLYDEHWKSLWEAAVPLDEALG